MSSNKESGDTRSRKTKPMESTRISTVNNPDSQATGQDSEKQPKLVKNVLDAKILGDASFNDSHGSVGALDTTFTVERNHLKHEFNGLNHRLISYMDRVKQNEQLLMKAEADRQAIQEQLEQNRNEHSKQLEMLRYELDEHVRQAVLAEEKQSQLERKVQSLHEERKSLKAELSARSKREASLERALVSERNELRTAHSKISQLHEQWDREKEERKSIADEYMKLKVDNAKLHERMKIATMELTMQECKVSEAEKKLQFTSEDVKKKLHEQRTQLEKLGMEKLEEIRRKHQSEIARLKKEHQVDKQNTLITYVSAEKYAQLDTEMKECAHKLEEAELRLADREQKLRTADKRIAELTTAHEKELSKERKRREKLSKKLVEQNKNHEDIRQELDNYRKLIEGLDVNENPLFNTPFGAKRPRVSFDIRTPAGDAVKKPEASATPSHEGRRTLTRRVLTPVRKTSTTASAISKEICEEQGGTHRDCKMM